MSEEEIGNLSLELKENEKVFIGGEITINVFKINRHKVRLFFKAPKKIKIIREELLLREENYNE